MPPSIVSLKYAAKPDANAVIFDAAVQTADTTSSKIDFGVAGGCPEVALFIDIAAITGGNTDIVILTSDDDSTYTAIPLQLRAIAATGEYVILLNNAIIQTRYFKLKNDLNTATSVTISAWMHPLQ